MMNSMKAAPDAVGANYGPEEIRSLPMVISYSDLIRCGLRKADIPQLITNGQLTYFKAGPTSRRRYHRIAVEKILGL